MAHSRLSFHRKGIPHQHRWFVAALVPAPKIGGYLVDEDRESLDGGED